MKYRLAAFAALIVLVFATVTIAQGGQARVEGKSDRGKGIAIAKNLGLTKEQMQQIGGIVKQYRADVRTALRSEGSREDKKAKVEELRTKAAAAIDAVLTPEQQDKAKQMRLTDRVLALRPHHDGAKVMWVLKQLNLTQEQQAQVKTIMDESRTQAKAIKDDTTLTPEAKRAKYAELKKSTFERIKGLLTAEQLQKLDELTKNRPQPGKQVRSKRAS